MPDSNQLPIQHAVIIFLKPSDDGFGTFEERESAFALEDRLESIVASSGVGEYDGHEFGNGWCRFYIYGDDADTIASIVIPAAKASSALAGSFAIKRFGLPGALQERVAL